MGGLPNIPNLDPDADPSEDRGDQGVAVSFDEPGGLADALEPDEDEDEDEEERHDYADTVAMNPSDLVEKLAAIRDPQPEAPAVVQPVAAPSPPAEPAVVAPSTPAIQPASQPEVPAPAAEPNHAEESLEEVLAQNSEHTIRLMRLEETLLAMKEILDDTREEMHAGFIQAGQPTDAKAGPAMDTSGLSGRLAEVELQAGRLERAQGKVLLFGVVQLVALAILAIVILVVAPSRAKVDVPPPFGTTAIDKIAPPPTAISEPEPEPARKKRRRRR